MAYYSNKYTSQLIESGGDVLTIGSISDGDVLVRTGTSIVGTSPGTSGNVLRSNGSVWASATLSIDDLSLGSIADGQAVIRTGAQLEGVTPGTAGNVMRSSGAVWASSALALDDLSDVTAGTPVQGSVLANDGAGQFQNTVRALAIATTSTPIMVIRNTTPATAGVPVQYSGGLLLGGEGFKTGDASYTEDWMIENHPSGGGSVSSVLAFMRRQEAGGWGTFFTIKSNGDAVVSARVQSIGELWLYGALDRSLGLGNCNHVLSAADRPVGFSSESRSDGANNVVCFSVWDAGVAGPSAVTNRATMPLHTMGVSDGAGTYYPVHEFFVDGHSVHAMVAAATATLAHQVGPSTTEGLQRYIIEETLSPSDIETSMTTAVPAGAKIIYVDANCESALTGGGTTVTWGLGITGNVDKYGTAGYPSQADALTQNSKSSWVGAVTTGSAAETIKLIAAATGGTPAGDTALTVGSVRVVVIYEKASGLANA
jgi:hypothetical protein